MAEVLKRWNGSEWVVVANVIRMINGSIYPPGIYGTIGEELIIPQSVSTSDIVTSTIAETVSLDLISDVAENPTQSLSVSDITAVSGITETITVEIT